MVHYQELAAHLSPVFGHLLAKVVHFSHAAHAFYTFIQIKLEKYLEFS